MLRRISKLENQEMILEEITESAGCLAFSLSDEAYCFLSANNLVDDYGFVSQDAVDLTIEEVDYLW